MTVGVGGGIWQEGRASSSSNSTRGARESPVYVCTTRIYSALEKRLCASWGRRRTTTDEGIFARAGQPCTGDKKDQKKVKGSKEGRKGYKM